MVSELLYDGPISEERAKGAHDSLMRSIAQLKQGEVKVDYGEIHIEFEDDARVC